MSVLTVFLSQHHVPSALHPDALGRAPTPSRDEMMRTLRETTCMASKMGGEGNQGSRAHKDEEISKDRAQLVFYTDRRSRGPSTRCPQQRAGSKLPIHRRAFLSLYQGNCQEILNRANLSSRHPRLRRVFRLFAPPALYVVQEASPGRPPHTFPRARAGESTY